MGGPTTGHKEPHKNRTIFSLLMNKTPFRRIYEVYDIHPATLYAKLDFLATQCRIFAGEWERRLQEGLPIRRLYLGTDRQDYLVNWMRQADRRNILLHAVGTADNVTGYVFGMHLNYDPAADHEAINAAATACETFRNIHPWAFLLFAHALQKLGTRQNGCYPLPV